MRINEWMADPGSEHIGVVVMNPNNGEVLAMANNSMFDLNNPRSAADSFSEEELREMGLKEAMQTYNRQHKKSQTTAPSLSTRCRNIIPQMRSAPTDSGGLEPEVAKLRYQ